MKRKRAVQCQPLCNNDKCPNLLFYISRLSDPIGSDNEKAILITVQSGNDRPRPATGPRTHTRVGLQQPVFRSGRNDSFIIRAFIERGTEPSPVKRIRSVTRTCVFAMRS